MILIQMKRQYACFIFQVNDMINIFVYFLQSFSPIFKGLQVSGKGDLMFSRSIQGRGISVEAFWQRLFVRGFLSEAFLSEAFLAEAFWQRLFGRSILAQKILKVL